METNFSPISPKNFICIPCGITCVKKSEWDRHINTNKHFGNTNGEIGNMFPTPPLYSFACNCGKAYKNRTGLWKHKKKCKNVNTSDEEPYSYYEPDYLSDNDDEVRENQIIASTEKKALSVNNDVIMSFIKENSDFKNLILDVVKGNSDFQKQMMEMCKSMQSTIISNNCNNTTNNNTFNLQVFLNEHCKDAMNISEFIDSFDLQISDLENVGRVGYIEGMSSIIINKIKELDVNKRPIHCSDLKREIIYIKDDDVWEREDANNTKFRKVIKKVAGKNIGMLNDWRDMYPECMDVESEYNDVFVKLTRTAMGPSDTEGTEAKIMKKIIKHVVIDKKALTQ